MPARTCVGCRKVADKNELVRVVMTPSGAAVDPEGCAAGRGVYVCPAEDCLAAALKKNAIARGLKVSKADTVSGFAERLKDER
ncbi:MAG: YlxR family protein [Actinomycetota bacterium]